MASFSVKKRNHQKIDAINDPEKESKIMPKGFQNDAKMESKITDFSWFFEKGKNARNHCIYKLKRGSGHVKSNEKSM